MDSEFPCLIWKIRRCRSSVYIFYFLVKIILKSQDWKIEIQFVEIISEVTISTKIRYLSFSFLQHEKKKINQLVQMHACFFVCAYAIVAPYLSNKGTDRSSWMQQRNFEW